MIEVEGVWYTQEQLYQGVKLANGNYLSHKRLTPPPRVLHEFNEGLECNFNYFRSVYGMV